MEKYNQIERYNKKQKLYQEKNSLIIKDQEIKISPHTYFLLIRAKKALSLKIMIQEIKRD